jgi:hypothetical protein
METVMAVNPNDSHRKAEGPKQKLNFIARILNLKTPGYLN